MVERGPLVLRPASAIPELCGSVELSRAWVLACERHPQLATVIAYKGRRADVAARLKDRYALSLPDGPRRATRGASALIGLGPRSWLFQRETGPALEPELSEVLGDAAAVTNQSDGYVVFRLTGPRVRDVLAKGISIDLHDRVFVPGCSVGTTCAHIGVILWRLEDANDVSVFELAVFRSLARSLWHFIEESAAEFGLAVTPAC
ncbi:MAG: sarcosine oxidase subunit gamma [Bradyrhizobium sp.]|uniref:sarcosine oxidase subunit gamma n=1 Tax=Bradyrhizobium sp. TaxID=376 RepID=UPI0025BCE773|nr:sarcosine oxidase subunit gamma family protein [Bradyrhizobium sp.]MBI5263356.1 sarcosine oxidase subunit gamma [Bradyrhizobium sp.]